MDAPPLRHRGDTWDAAPRPEGCAAVEALHALLAALAPVKERPLSHDGINASSCAIVADLLVIDALVSSSFGLGALRHAAGRCGDLLATFPATGRPSGRSSGSPGTFVASFAAAMIPARGGTTHGWLVLAPARHLLKPERPAGMVGASGDARRPRGMASRCYHAGDELRPRAWAALLRDGARRQLLLGAPSRRKEWTSMS